MVRLIILAVALAALWFLLSGEVSIDEIKALLAGENEFPLVLVFLAVSLVLCGWLAARARVLDDEGVPLSVFPGLIFYWGWLLLEIGKANLIVAREALAVRPRLSPMLVSVPADQVSDVGKVIFANSITLTPGTVSVDLHRNAILVHALTEDLADLGGLRDMGRRVREIEGKPERDGAQEARS